MAILHAQAVRSWFEQRVAMWKASFGANKDGLPTLRISAMLLGGRNSAAAALGASAGSLADSGAAALRMRGAGSGSVRGRGALGFCTKTVRLGAGACCCCCFRGGLMSSTALRFRCAASLTAGPRR